MKKSLILIIKFVIFVFPIFLIGVLFGWIQQSFLTGYYYSVDAFEAYMKKFPQK